MLVLQHLWSHWTKASRGAAVARPTLPQALPLLPPEVDALAWRHEARLLEHEAFALLERAGPLTPESWRASEPLHPANLSWRWVADEVHVSVHRPWPDMLRTAWPQHLPSPLMVLLPGERVRLDWNGRFANSLNGSNRGYFYAEHRVWIANVAEPSPDLFLRQPPRKHIDLRTKIY